MVDTTDFDQIRIGLASPDDIRKWSHGEVLKLETIYNSTFQPVPDGLFCEKIFGPTRDWECHCGKYRKIKFRGIVCDRCGVEVMRAKVRRERMGHIELAAPVAHIWYLKNVPSPMSLMLDLSPRPLEKVLYFASYIITKVDSELLLANNEAIRFAVDERKHELDEQLQEVIQILEDQFQEDIAANTELSARERNKIIEARDERICIERKQVEDRKTELDIALHLLLGPDNATPSLMHKQLLSEPEHHCISNLADEVDIFVCLHEGEESDLPVPSDDSDGEQTSGVRIVLRNDPSKTLLSSQTGAEAIKTLLKQIDIEEKGRQLRKIIRETTGPKRARAVKQLEVVESFRKSKNRPEWLILDSLPVIPPELRPMIQLDAARFATSDLNVLYQRIINRNNRLKKITDLRAPESIINHEKRLLQEAVDALIDNGRRSLPVTGNNNLPLKSLSEMLKGKNGSLCNNLFGKCVDYSGSSVIVVGPHLTLNQCGLPKEMALELFKPFVMKRLVQKGLTINVKTAKPIIDRVQKGIYPLKIDNVINKDIWDALEDVIQGYLVILNRAPTLDRMGIMAFEPVLVDGKAIQLHPLVCTTFNAVFDGDQMAVHVPLSTSAQAEARILMMSTENLFSPANGKPVMTPTRDMVLGAYYMTSKGENNNLRGWGKYFIDTYEAILAYQMKIIDLHAEIKVRLNGTMMCTTVGRIIFNQILPPKLQFLDRLVDAAEMENIVRTCFDAYGLARTVTLLEDLKELGFKYSTISGVSIAITDMDVPSNDLDIIVANTEKAVRETNNLFADGIISEGELSQTVCELWMRATDDVDNALLKRLDPFSPLLMMSNSGACGNKRQLSQLAGIRGIMTDPCGRLIEDLPIKSNFHEGLNVLEYFVSTHGARKGLADTALRTADAGYLTRRMVDVAQDVIVRAHDCGTHAGIEVGAIRDRQEEIEPLDRRIDGRIVVSDIYNPFTGKLIIRRNQEIGNRTLPVCPKDESQLHRAWYCQECETVITDTDFDDAVHHLSRTKKIEKTLVADEEILHVMSDAEWLMEGLQDDSRLLDDELKDNDEQIGEITLAPEDEPSADITADEIAKLFAAVEDKSLKGEQEQEEIDFRAQEREIDEKMLLIEEAVTNEVCSDCGFQLYEISICEDCGTRYIHNELESPLAQIRRVVAESERFMDDERKSRSTNLSIKDAIVDPFTHKVIVLEGEIPTDAQKQEMIAIVRKLRGCGGLASGKVPIRSSLTCELRQGICSLCYGRDMATGRIVEAGEAVGIIAAQSIGAGSLKLRTFNTGGVASQYLTGVANVKDQRIRTLQQIIDDVNRGRVQLSTEISEREKVNQIQKMVKMMEQQVSGLLRVVELFEARKPKGQAIISDVDCVVSKIDSIGGGRSVVIHTELPVQPEEEIIGKLLGVTIINPQNDEVMVEAGRELTPPLVAKIRHAGVASVVVEDRYMVPYRGSLRVDTNDTLKAGNPLTEGPLDPQELLRMRGPREVQEYLVAEIQRVYRSQGVDINDKHMETIVRQMLRRRRVTEPGDTDFFYGQTVNRFEFEDENKRIKETGGQVADADWVLLGITKASLATDSFLSVASFQNTTRVLTDAAIKGKVDHLVGLKENVIIGRLIPAGTGMDRYRNLKVVSPSDKIKLVKPEIVADEQDFVERILEEIDLGLRSGIDDEAEIVEAYGTIEGPNEEDNSDEDDDEPYYPTTDAEI